MSLGLYLHIPYCFSKCRYCDFYSHPGERGVPDAYVDALLRELHRFAPDAPLRPDTLFFGGGTPSLLDPADAARLIAAAQPLPGAEITLEANPETVTEDSLRAFREAGVNRISFGVQSENASLHIERNSQFRVFTTYGNHQTVIPVDYSLMFKCGGIVNAGLHVLQIDKILA